MRLLPQEHDRLELHLAGELARRRRGRGLKLSQAEAAALIADETMELARDGLGYGEVERGGYRILGADDVLDGVGELVDRIELEPVFGDGPRLIVLFHPVAARPAAGSGSAGPETEYGTTRCARSRSRTPGAVPVAVTSHFHFFETNRALRFDRRRGVGHAARDRPRHQGRDPAGASRQVGLVPFAGARVIRGHGGLVDGALDAEGALDAALALARERGYADAGQ